MPRRRRYPAPRGRRSYNDYDDYRPRQRQRRRGGGCLAPVKRFFRNVVIVLLTAIGAIVFFIVVLLIAFNFALFVKIMIYVLYIAAGLAILGVVYLVVRLIAAMSHKISAASIARSKARVERERVRIEQERVLQARTQVRQGNVQVRSQQAKLERENYAFYQKYERQQDEQLGYPTRRTRNFRDDPYPDYPQVGRNMQQSYRTRNLREVNQEPLVRVLSQLSTPPQQVQEPPQIPHITQLLGTTILFGQKDMLYGFEMEQGHLVEVRGDWPGTAIIAGRSGSGKTRRVIIMVFQAILAGQKITICDPHAYKPDGLIKVLAPFAPWLHFARTDTEIIAAAREHIVECKSRLSPAGSLNNEGLTPRLIIIDEFPALMTSEDIRLEDKRAIAKCVRESATQFRGVFGAAWIIGQEFTEDALGDTAIRKDAHAILCHQLSDEYVKFLFPRDLKVQRLIQQIERRECIYKDNDNHVRRIVTPTVLDEEIPSMVDFLRQMMAPSTTLTAQAVTLPHPETEPLVPRRNYGASAYRQTQASRIPARQSAAPQQQKLILRRTQLIQQDQPFATQAPALTPSAGAIWGEETQVNPPSPSPQPPVPSTGPMTEELAPKKLVQANPPTTPRQDTFEMLALLRTKKKK